jgi:hypothetical protein
MKASSRLNIVKNHDNTYIRDDLKSLELQSKWITLSKYPLPNKKYVKELDSSITLSVPLVENDELYAFFKHLDEFVESQNLCPNKKQNKFIKTEERAIFLKVKLYITTNIFIHGDTKPKPKVSIMDFYNYLKEGTEMRFVFSIGKMYEINGEYGFPIYAHKNTTKRATEKYINIYRFSMKFNLNVFIWI